MPVKVLVIGEKFSELVPFLQDSPPQNEVLDVSHLSEGDYDPADLPTYLSHDVIISPYRPAILNLALGRQDLKGHGVVLILATGAQICLSHLVSGSVCDAIVTDDFEAIASEIVKEREPRSNTVTEEAIIQFMSYLSRDQEGLPEWSISQHDIALTKAINLYADWLGSTKTLPFRQSKDSSRYTDQYRPFEMLKLIRDGVITTNVDCLGSLQSEFQYDTLIKGLERIGLIESKPLEQGNPNTRIRKIEPQEPFFELLRALQARLTELSNYEPGAQVLMPVFGKTSTDFVRADVFVVMPFDSRFSRVYDVIKLAAADQSLTVSRGDDYRGAHAVIANIWSAIVNAKCVVADTTELNANVFYEIGIAHTLGKPVILLTQDIHELPFDLKHLRAIHYNTSELGFTTLRTTLNQTMTAAINAPRTLEKAHSHRLQQYQ